MCSSGRDDAAPRRVLRRGAAAGRQCASTASAAGSAVVAGEAARRAARSARVRNIVALPSRCRSRRSRPTTCRPSSSPRAPPGRARRASRRRGRRCTRSPRSRPGCSGARCRWRHRPAGSSRPSPRRRPACCGATPSVASWNDAGMIDAIPTPRMTRPGRTFQVGAVDLERGEPQHAERAERHADRHQHLGAEPRQQDVALDLGGDDDRDDHRQERDTGLHRRCSRASPAGSR